MRSPNAKGFEVSHEFANRAFDRKQNQYPSLRELLRPCVLGFVGLAIAVTLWGFGYKLSLYLHPPNTVSRVSVARLWFEQRNSFVAATPRPGARANGFSRLHPFEVPAQRFPRLSPGVTCVVPYDARGVRIFHSLIPSRGPPSFIFLLM